MCNRNRSPNEQEISALLERRKGLKLKLRPKGKAKAKVGGKQQQQQKEEEDGIFIKINTNKQDDGGKWCAKYKCLEAFASAE